MKIWLLDWSPSPSDPNGPMGYLTHAPWSGALQLNPSWWAPVAPRNIKGGGGQRLESRGSPPPPPHRHSETLTDLVERGQRREASPPATSTLSASTRTRTRALDSGHRSANAYGWTSPSSCTTPPMAGTSASASALGHEGMPCFLSLSLNLSVTRFYQ
jgi:hypothetical protein